MKTETTPAKTEFRFNCPTCGQHILAATEWSGLEISCPSCQTRIRIPSPASEELNAKPATPSDPARGPNPSARTIRIELPIRASQGTAKGNGQATESKPTSVVTPTEAPIEDSPRMLGSEPWPDLVRKLEKGTLIAPAELATALFHELREVRRRLDQLESKLAPEKPAITEAVVKGPEDAKS